MSALGELLDPSLLWEYRALLLRGLLKTLEVFGLSLALALTLGFLAALAAVRGRPWLRRLSIGLCEFVRNIPEYVLIIWLYIALPVFISRLFDTRVSFEAQATAVIALGLVFSGYFAETFRAGFQATPRGQTEAGEALGLSPRDVTLRILLPQIVLRLAPELLNVSISLFKSTSIVSLIGVQDLMYQASLMTSQLMRPVPIYTGTALIFVVTILTASLGVRWLAHVLNQRIA
ncbi:amino acid ABC transporter permease [Acuticoccus kandeliae]|uniref:amino acid ABC transporter permease n=1 Tax=Acuticoccus kandeliae TaxID=2073160 RepID=UPI000D3ECC08|nr:amino acid ABC transporter permease [Acuticoccus kandeliae]